MNLESRMSRHPRDVLRGHGLRADTALGQIFLVDTGVMERIVEAASPGGDALVLEIGTGLGRLTARLAAVARAVVTVEIDKGLCRLASSLLQHFPNVRLLSCDFLETKHRINPAVTRAVSEALADCGGRLKVVSNLPYCISSPAIVNLLEWELRPSEIAVMLQEEVARRICNRGGSKDYGPLSVLVDYWSQAEVLFSVHPRAFWPVPDVSSAFVRIRTKTSPPPLEDYRTFSEVVNRLFQSRRKTLSRALVVGWGKDRSRQVLEDTSIDPRLRPESLTTAQFISIAKALTP